MAREFLPPDEAAVFMQIVADYVAEGKPAQTRRRLVVLSDIIGFLRKAPWERNQNDLALCCVSLGCVDHWRRPRPLSALSQRSYQLAVMDFLAYLVGNQKFKIDVQRQYQPPRFFNQEVLEAIITAFDCTLDDLFAVETFQVDEGEGLAPAPPPGKARTKATRKAKGAPATPSREEWRD